MNAEDSIGEEVLHGELSALVIRDGVAYASDDVSGALLDPSSWVRPELLI